MQDLCRTLVRGNQPGCRGLKSGQVHSLWRAAMLTTTIQPRFGDADCLGHVTRTALALWFETARNSLLRIFLPDLNFKMESFPLIIAHTDYDFVNELFPQYEVEIRTWVSHIGNESFTVYHQAWQNGRLCVKGSVVAVHYDFTAKQSTPLPADKKKRLKAHLMSAQKNPRPKKKGTADGE